MKSDSPNRLVTGIFLKLVALTLVVGALLRIVLLCNIAAPEGTGFGFTDYITVFALGAVNDACVAVIGLLFLWLFTVTLIPQKYGRVAGGCILAVLTATLLYLWLAQNPLEEFNRGLARVVRWVLVYWIATFALRMALPRIRRNWTRTWLAIILSIYVIVIYFNAVSEFFFWAEFNVRYNFIAVDYLIYTNEVIGNIMESYSVVPLVIGTVALSAATVWLFFRHDIARAPELYSNRWKLRFSIVYLAAVALSCWILKADTALQKSENTYRNELQANGAYKFYEAFLANELSFERFYPTLPEAEAETIIHGIYGSRGENLRYAAPADSVDSLRPNIVLITVESMSADFMERYGNTEGLTPNLDSIAGESLTFDRTFATGNRTVRGLEALTLSLPPCPGQSIVKRPDNVGRSSTGQVLRDKGYDTYYFYGGNSYFDNMGSFFGNNGYTVVDINDYRPEQITFKNVWGVCDENAFDKVIQTLSDRYGGDRADKSPFFAQVMTISNHRPYTYPEGRIDIPADSKSRAGGVKYTDYAIGRFIREARQTPWGCDAVYVIVADHCASSAGKTDLPIEKYHIPAMIHAPGRIAPAAIDKVVSQIDIIPTMLSLVGIGYESRFFGRDVLAPDYEPRAFMATYQDLGYLQDSTLTVLSPVKRLRQLHLQPTADNPFNTVPAAGIDSVAARRAVALYQTSAAWNR